MQSPEVRIGRRFTVQSVQIYYFIILNIQGSLAVLWTCLLLKGSEGIVSKPAGVRTEPARPYQIQSGATPERNRPFPPLSQHQKPTEFSFFRRERDGTEQSFGHVSQNAEKSHEKFGNSFQNDGRNTRFLNEISPNFDQTLGGFEDFSSFGIEAFSR